MQIGCMGWFLAHWKGAIMLNITIFLLLLLHSILLIWDLYNIFLLNTKASHLYRANLTLLLNPEGEAIWKLPQQDSILTVLPFTHKQKTVPTAFAHILCVFPSDSFEETQVFTWPPRWEMMSLWVCAEVGWDSRDKTIPIGQSKANWSFRGLNLTCSSPWKEP